MTQNVLAGVGESLSVKWEAMTWGSGCGSISELCALTLCSIWHHFPCSPANLEEQSALPRNLCVRRERKADIQTGPEDP